MKMVRGALFPCVSLAVIVHVIGYGVCVGAGAGEVGTSGLKLMDCDCEAIGAACMPGIGKLPAMIPRQVLGMLILMLGVG